MATKKTVLVYILNRFFDQGNPLYGISVESPVYLVRIVDAFAGQYLAGQASESAHLGAVGKTNSLQLVLIKQAI